MLAVRRPSAASLSCCACSRARVVSSTNSTENSSSARGARAGAGGCRGRATSRSALRRRAAGRQPRQRCVERRQQRASSAPSSARAEQALRLRVVLHHAAVAVEHQHAVVHVLDHQLVDARLRGELAAALARQALVRGDALRQPAGHAGGGEAADREQRRAAGSSRWARRARAPSSPARAAARWWRARRTGRCRRRGATIAAPMSEISSITPRPLRMPPLAYMSSVMATMSSAGVQRELQVEAGRAGCAARRGTPRRGTDSRRRRSGTGPGECEPRLSASP